MSESLEDDILKKIHETFVPFLKNIVSALCPETFKRFKRIFEAFTEADKDEQIAVYNGSKDQLEELYHIFYSKIPKLIEPPDKADAVENGDESEPVLEITTTETENKTEQTPDSFSSPETLVNEVTKDESKRVSAEVLVEQPKDQSDSAVALPPTSAVETSLSTESSFLKSSTSVHKIQRPIGIVKPMRPTVEDGCIFVCAACSFRTSSDCDFTNHVRTDHRFDLSLWCKECGKCFSNAGVLVSHIKERSCHREEMIYRCGIKSCTFETSSGQSFVHHLRHCHKGSPFLFCVHCQKIFTLPHCLIIHMQTECPYRARNRPTMHVKNHTPSTSNMMNQVSTSDMPSTSGQPQIGFRIKRSTTGLTLKQLKKAKNSITKKVSFTNAALKLPKQEERKSGAKKKGKTVNINEVNAGASTSGMNSFVKCNDTNVQADSTTTLKISQRSRRAACREQRARVLAEQKKNLNVLSSPKRQKRHGKMFFYCPCCDFSAIFQSVLDDHLITDHKDPNRISCLICKAKFRSITTFLDHFSKHDADRSS